MTFCMAFSLFDLKFIKADTEKIVMRFYKACIGWIRYKPLLLYITEPTNYEKKIEENERAAKGNVAKNLHLFSKIRFHEHTC